VERSASPEESKEGGSRTGERRGKRHVHIPGDIKNRGGSWVTGGRRKRIFKTYLDKAGAAQSQKEKKD